MSALDLAALRALAKEALERTSEADLDRLAESCRDGLNNAGGIRSLAVQQRVDAVRKMLGKHPARSDVPALAAAVEQLCAALEEERSEVERLTRDRASLMGISERTRIESNEAHVTIERMKPVVDAAAKWKVALPEELRRVVVAFLGAASSHPTSDVDATCSACGAASTQLLVTGAAGSSELCVRCYHTAAEEALRAHATDRAAWEAERATLTKERDAARAEVDRAIAERAQILAERIVVDRKAERYYVHWQGALMSSEANAATVRSLAEERNALDVRVEQLEAALAALRGGAS